MTDLSAVQTANFMLLEDQLSAVILAAPSWQAKIFFKYLSCIVFFQNVILVADYRLLLLNSNIVKNAKHFFLF